MLDFLSENYIWLIVIGVFIIMIIVGYFADKNQNKEKKPKLKDHVDELDNQETETNDVKIDEWEETPVPKEEDEVIEVKGLDNSFDSWDNNMENSTTNSEELNQENESLSSESDSETIEPVVENMETDIQEPLVESEEPNFEEPITFSEGENSNDEVMEESSGAETTEPVAQETTETTEETNPIEDLEITLPNIDTLNEEIKDVVDAEDVWKF